MNFKTLTAQLSVSSQIAAADVPDIKNRGFSSIICNRPDQEAADQPSFDDIAAVATELGLQVAYLPVVSGHMTAGDAEAFVKLLEDLPGPVLAYCRSGTRSEMLWSAGQARGA